MPPTVRDLITLLMRAGFDDRGGTGSHRNFTHPAVRMPVPLSGDPDGQAKSYQVRQVKAALEESQK